MTSTGRTRARRQSIIRPRRSRMPAASVKSAGSSVGLVASRWFGMISVVASNQKREMPVRTRPLSGIGVGRTTSNAESRSLATRSRRSPTSNRSRTLPLRTKPAAGEAVPAFRGSPGLAMSAGGIGSLLSGRSKHVQASHGGGHVPQEVAFVEAGGERFVRETGGDIRIGGEQLAQLAAFIGGTQRIPLDHSVRLLAGKAGLLDQGQQDAAAAVEAQAPLYVLAHPVRPDDQSLNQAAGLHQHVVEQDRGVGKEHALGRGVADIALVPERLILQSRHGVA